MYRMPIFLKEGEYKPNSELKSKEKTKKKLVYTFLEKNTNSNKWTPLENQTFLRFVQMNRELLECPIKRKKQKIFLEISKSIKTRSPDQCRNHHQKMTKHHGNIDGIILHLKKRLFGIVPPKEEAEELQKGTLNYVRTQDAEKINVFETNVDFQMLEENQSQENIWSVFNSDIWMYNLELESDQNECSINQ